MQAFRPGNLSPSLPICKEMPCPAAFASGTVPESSPFSTATVQGTSEAPGLPHPELSRLLPLPSVHSRRDNPVSSNSDNNALLLKTLMACIQLPNFRVKGKPVSEPARPRSASPIWLFLPGQLPALLSLHASHTTLFPVLPPACPPVVLFSTLSPQSASRMASTVPYLGKPSLTSLTRSSTPGTTLLALCTPSASHQPPPGSHPPCDCLRNACLRQAPPGWLPPPPSSSRPST